MTPIDRLPPRQHDVVRLALAGKRNSDIAQHFGRSEQVIKNWMLVIYDRLGVWSRLEDCFGSKGDRCR